MKKLYVFGNEHLAEDRLARQVSRLLSGRHEIVHCRSPDELLECEDEEILILDVVRGIKEPVIIEDIEKVRAKKIMTLHDFDLGYFLNLMKLLGVERKVKIIGIPAEGNVEELAKKVEEWA
ncbi:hypothetical protein J4212_01795 [Candidatus Woesearchaeota archaeon]|nr:hypothetical protein [Candidatus Woesearchaeota archaeon]